MLRALVDKLNGDESADPPDAPEAEQVAGTGSAEVEANEAATAEAAEAAEDCEEENPVEDDAVLDETQVEEVE